ncbi:hypothetical protein JSE7799_01859 [Jannaschia seosinensis]|uniref:Uncharacterized protein n=1 Tax=Jannaschia seosinensis TaxID=313367 RepID=A0A0M7BAQ1_9RHOB|nr:hypothetical protein JSE7799_01859 [Jannaschia seosinensis]
MVRGPRDRPRRTPPAVLSSNPSEVIAHARRRRRIPGQGQDHQRLSRQRLQGAGQLRTCSRPRGQGRLRRSRRLGHDVGSAGGLEEADQGNRRRAGRRSQPDPRHRPRPRGRGDLLAPAGGAHVASRHQEGHADQPRGLQRHHQEGRSGSHRQPARDRPPAGPRLSGAPCARLPRGFQPQPGPVAQAARLEIGGPGAVGVAASRGRARDGDRGVRCARILVGPHHAGDAARPDLRGAARGARRKEARPLRPRRRDAGRACRAGRRDPRPQRRFRRGQARHPQSRAALHDLHASAGGQPQVRHGREGRHVHGAASLRGRAHHLHADRRDRHGARGRPRRPRRDQGPLRRQLRPCQPAHVQEQGQERAGSA